LNFEDLTPKTIRVEPPEEFAGALKTALNPDAPFIKAVATASEYEVAKLPFVFSASGSFPQKKPRPFFP
jgi:hypothetical protein